MPAPLHWHRRSIAIGRLVAMGGMADWVIDTPPYPSHHLPSGIVVCFGAQRPDHPLPSPPEMKIPLPHCRGRFPEARDSGRPQPRSPMLQSACPGAWLHRTWLNHTGRLLFWSHGPSSVAEADQDRGERVAGDRLVGGWGWIFTNNILYKHCRSLTPLGIGVGPTLTENFVSRKISNPRP